MSWKILRSEFLTHWGVGPKTLLPWPWDLAAEKQLQKLGGSWVW